MPGDAEAIPATFLRINVRDLMERVKFRGERFVVETFGRPMMVLISYEDYLCIRQYLPHCADDAGTKTVREKGRADGDPAAVSLAPSEYLAQAATDAPDTLLRDV